MRIPAGDDLTKFVVTHAKDVFGSQTFSRRALMLEVEKVLRQWNLWTEDDDAVSGSHTRISKGLALIDYAIATANGQGLKHIGRDEWQVDYGASGK